MIWIATILIAAIPHTVNPWAVSALAGFAFLFTMIWLRGFLLALANNQTKIFQNLG